MKQTGRKLVSQLREMLSELQGNRLEVALLERADEDGESRGNRLVVVSQNAGWYRVLCGNHLTTRRRYPKPRTVIRRVHTVRALKRMMSGDRTSVYAQRILDVMAWVF